MGRPPAAIDPKHLRSLAAELSDEEIASRLGCARVTVTSARRRHRIPSFTERTGLKRRGGQVTYGGRRRSVLFQEDFFSELDTQEKAYFLGLLAADGSVARRGNTIEIQLAEPDEHILHKMVACIEGSGCVVRPHRRADRVKTFHRLTLCSKQMAEDLRSWGLTPGKTENFEIRRPIPQEQLRHFVRGFWDGDGSVGRNHFEVGIRSQAFALEMRSMIARIGGERPPLRQGATRLGNPFYVIAVASRRFDCFRRELYRDARCFLYRKHSRFQEFWS